jgi:demethylmenaquinone methyltransferase / 2-methoxy-6-polyprenyl-1,4-benzoquinol methylase
VDETFAKAFLPVNRLTKLDLPTLDLPIKAYSGSSEAGQSSTLAKLPTKPASWIILTVKLSAKVHVPPLNFVLLQLNQQQRMSDHNFVTPYGEEKGAKKEQVATMFNNISGNYDFLNHFFSMGIDKLWRKKVVKMLEQVRPKRILDVATGTGDLAIAALDANPEKVIGIDISEGMLEKGRKKVSSAKMDARIELQYGDSESIQFPNHYFDAVTVAFGVRNYQHLERGLSEMNRVLKPGAPLIVLEFSKPQNWFIRQLYYFYFCNVLPFIGKLVSKDPRAYTYLPESVRAFPDGEVFAGKLKEAGFKKVECTPLTFGISTIYRAEK